MMAKVNKKVIALLLAILMVFSVIGIAAGVNDRLGSVSAASSTPVQNHGALKVSGSKLVDQNGKQFQICGVSTHGINWDVGAPFCNAAAFKTLRDDWGVNLVRIAMYTTEYNGYCSGGNKTTLKNQVCSAVDSATSLGMYVIIDWHILSDGNPQSHATEAKEFFTYMAKKYANNSNVLYEICNEPNGGTSWSTIKSYATNIIKTIRTYDKSGIIIVGTPTWSQDVDVVSKSPITGYSNIMYAMHFYADTHRDDYRAKLKTAVNNGLPIFVSEFGVCDASGNGAVNTSQTQTWLNLLDSYKIPYVCWSLSNKNETASLLKSSTTKTSGWTVDQLSSAGKLIRSEYQKRSDAFMGTPKLSSTTNLSAGIQVKWSKVTDATGYYVYKKLNGGSFSKIATVKDGSTSFTDTTAASGKTYYYTVKAYDSNGRVSGYNTTGIRAVRLLKPVLAAASTNSSGVKVGWSKIAGANGYYVFRKTASSDWKLLSTVKSGSTVSYTDKKVTAGTTYYYTVRAYNGTSKSTFDSIGSVIKYMKTPAISGVVNATTGAKISWTKVAGAGGYYIFRKNGTASYKKIGTVSSTASSYYDKTAVSGTTYTYTVRAYSGASMSYYNTSGKALKYLKMPSLNVPSDVTSGIKISWTKTAGANGYYVFRKTGSGSYTTIATIKSSSTLSYIDKKVTKGNTYTYTVRAYYGSTKSGYVASGVNIKRRAVPVLNAPVLSNPEIMEDGIALSWSETSGVDGYYVYRKLLSDGETDYTDAQWVRIGETTATSYIDKDVKLGNLYVYTVRSFFETTKSPYDKEGKAIINSHLDKPEVTANTTEDGQVKYLKVLADENSDSIYLLKYNEETKKYINEQVNLLEDQTEDEYIRVIINSQGTYKIKVEKLDKTDTYDANFSDPIIVW